MMRSLYIFCVMIAFGLAFVQGAVPASANSTPASSDFIEPASVLSPEEVVEIQLLGLQAAGQNWLLFGAPAS